MTKLKRTPLYESAEKLGGTMCQLTRCNSMGRQSKVIEIEYNVETKE